eukprot:gene1638-1816_t
MEFEEDMQDTEPTESNNGAARLPPTRFRGPSKKEFLKEKKQRTRTDGRMMKRVDRLVCVGDQAFAEFAENRIVAKEFTRVALKAMNTAAPVEEQEGRVRTVEEVRAREDGGLVNGVEGDYVEEGDGDDNDDNVHSDNVEDCENFENEIEEGGVVEVNSDGICDGNVVVQDDMQDVNDDGELGVLDGGTEGIGNNFKGALDESSCELGENDTTINRFLDGIGYESFTWTPDECLEFFNDPSKIPNFLVLRGIFSALPYIAPKRPAQLNISLDMLTDIISNVPCLITLITTDNVTRAFQAIEDEDNRLRHVVRGEVMESLQCYRYSSFLHLVLVALAMDININSIDPRRLGSLNHKINANHSAGHVDILWVPSSPDGNFNHTVPLLQPTEETHELENGHCALGDLCSFRFGIKTKHNLIKCKYCLRQYHIYCASLDSAKETPTDWSCFCHIRVDPITSLPAFASKHTLRTLLQTMDKAIMKYLADIVAGRIYSPRVKLFEDKAFVKLRDMAENSWFLKEDAEEELSNYVLRRSGRIRKYAKIDLTLRITLNLNVLVPETVCKDTEVPNFNLTL